MHRIGLFANKRILIGQELLMDYQWDQNELAIPKDIPCLCGSSLCRGLLMRSKKLIF
jgi:SET domain-containing protein